MNQPGKPGPGSNPKLGRLLDQADDVSIPVLTERVAVAPPAPPRAAAAASFTLDTGLPSFATQPQPQTVTTPPPAPRVPAPSSAPLPPAAAPERQPAPPAPSPRAVAPGNVSAQPSGASAASTASPLPPTSPSLALSPASPASPAPPAVPAGGAPTLPGPAPWGRIEIELRESILMDLAERLPREVESIVRGNMSAAIDMLVDRLSAETRIAVAASLRDIIDHAVKAELERLRNSRRGVTGPA